MLLGPHHPLWRTLRSAKVDAKAFVAAQDMVEAQPALTGRKILGTFSAVTWPRPPRRARS